MSMIEIKDVFFEYASYEDVELEEQRAIEEARRKKQEKRNKNKKNTEDISVFGELDEVKTDKNGAESERPAVNKKTNYAVSGVSVSIEEGEFIGLVGHNGSGKSTLAKLLNGLLTPSEGEVLFEGLSTKSKKNLFEIRKHVGMVFQNPDNQMIASIVEDDIAFGPENIGIESSEIQRRVDWALEAVGMSEYRRATPFKLSGGQKQRIAIAGMLAIMPKVLVLDESTAMLDPKGRREVMEVVKKLNREHGITIINITHYMDEVTECGRVLVMDEGRIVLDGSPREVFSKREKLLSIGLNIPSVMRLAQRLREKGLEIDENIFSTEELVERICQLSQGI